MQNIKTETFDRINDLESWLYNLKSIYIAIENLKLDLENIDIVGLGAMDYSGIGGHTNKINRATESKVFNAQDLENKLEKKIKYLETKSKKIENALRILNTDESKVIDQFYKYNKAHWKIALDMEIPEITCKRIKRRALNKLIIAIYGVEEAA